MGQDAPVSRVDLLTCRNALMYFNAEMQARILARFHFALKNDGFLFLGKAEMLFTHANLFVPIDLKRRIFARMPHAAAAVRSGQGSDRFPPLPPGSGDEASGNEEAGRALLSQASRLRDLTFEAGPTAEIVVDTNDILLLANVRARGLFRLDARADLNRPLRDLEISYRPVELRSLIEQARQERRTVSQRGVSLAHAGSDGTVLCLDVSVTPLADTGGALLGTSITFADMTRYQWLQGELEVIKHALETTNEELQSTNEVLETTNEELHSTVEELETTNEELHSSNEELETMNAELQSTNEELQGSNEQGRRSSEQADRLNAYMNAILTSLRGAVVVLDGALVVDVWSSRSEDLWGLRADEARGRSFLSLDIGLPVEQLAGVIRASVGGEATFQELIVDARNRLGRTIRCRITCTALVNPAASPTPFALRPTRGNGAAPVSFSPAASGVILVMEPLAEGEETRRGADGVAALSS